MIYREEKRDLFSVNDKYYLVHCISADFALGAGIAKEINRRYKTRDGLKRKYPNFLNKQWASKKRIMKIIGHKECDTATCIKTKRIFNLVTKERYYYKSTYEAMRRALIVLKQECGKNNIKYLAMPMVGCGLDRLQWDKVSALIKKTFVDTDIEILVCKR